MDSKYVAIAIAIILALIVFMIPFGDVAVSYDDGIESVDANGNKGIGEYITYTANPKEGMVVEGWYLMGVKVSEEQSITVISQIFPIHLSIYSKPGYNITLEHDEGISKTIGEGQYETENATIVAETYDNYIFKGWVSDKGELISKNLSYEITDRDTQTLYAMSEPIYRLDSDVTTYTLMPTMDLKDESAVWIISGKYQTITYDIIPEETPTISLNPGIYSATVTGYTLNGEFFKETKEIISEGDINYSWRYLYKTYNLDITFNADLYEYYLSSDVSRWPYPSDYSSFVTCSNPIIIKLSQDLSDMSIGMTEVQRANFVLSFVQSLKYQSDTDFKGQTEFWKFPIETLFDYGGDCEDTTILYVSLMKNMGYPVALLSVPGHLAAGIQINESVPGGYYLLKDNIEYYYAETTARGWDVGDMPDEYLNSDFKIYPIKERGSPLSWV